ncbi:hypothetical protein HC028_11405 [Planosporangium flavigriseum]|uniref:hypothetical protein n=1 Tax=Planosporangium flavigriseum TaxID=373681 RepID=UPI001438B568|nr:hypothetical protein [Planosporangium flavigriseum]NJC65104.1 hypothetical protein [Planosporangium flavigriseum]
MDIPDLTGFRVHRVVDAAEFEGVAVPGLSARFLRRACAGRVESVGCYRYRGQDLLLAWGFVDEDHCRWHSVRVDGGWQEPRPGCPDVRVVRDGERVVAFAVGDGRGGWLGDPLSTEPASLPAQSPAGRSAPAPSG